MDTIRVRTGQISGAKPPVSDCSGHEPVGGIIHANGLMVEDVVVEPPTPDAETTTDAVVLASEDIPATSSTTMPSTNSFLSFPASSSSDGLHPSVHTVQLGADINGISDQLSKYLTGRGVSHRSFDLLCDDAKSLLDTSCWETFLGKMRGENLHFVILAPPSLTFINSPTHGPLRTRLGPGIYGRKISSDLKSRVNAENVMWIRAAQIAAVLHGRGITWMMVFHLGPRFCSYPSDLYEVSQVLDLHGVSAYFHGRRDNTGNIVGEAVNIQAYGIDLDAVRTCSLHVALECLCKEVWRSALKCRLNNVQRLTSSTTTTPSSSSVRLPVTAGGQDIEFLERARPAQIIERHEEEVNAIGGLKRIKRSREMINRRRMAGAAINKELDKLFDIHPDLERKIYSGILEKKMDPISDADEELIAKAMATAVRCEDTARCSEKGGRSDIRSGLLKAWRIAEDDPDDQPEEWAVHGGPLGIMSMPLNRGIFPAKPDGRLEHEPEELLHDANHNGEKVASHPITDADDDAWKQLLAFVDAKFIYKCDTWSEVKRFVKRIPVVAQFLVQTRTKGKKTKKRFLLNLKRSGVSGASRNKERVLLPRLLDVVWDILDLLVARSSTGGDIDALIIDFKDAFYQIPALEEEMAFLVGVMRRTYFIYDRVAQGTRGAPLLWGRTVALVNRLTAGLFDLTKWRSSIYVDDPIIHVRGDAVARRQMLVRTVAVWMGLGFRLAFDKAAHAAMGTQITWTSGTIIIHDDCVIVSIKQTIVDEVTTEVKDFLSQNVIGKEALRSFLGRLVCISSLIFTWRPFVNMMWAPLYQSAACGNAPAGCIWLSQIRTPLYWIRAFLDGNAGGIERKFMLADYLGHGDDVTITCEASEHGCN